MLDEVGLGSSFAELMASWTAMTLSIPMCVSNSRRGSSRSMLFAGNGLRLVKSVVTDLGDSALISRRRDAWRAFLLAVSNGLLKLGGEEN